MKRYPGIRPFRTDEQALFFGRDADIERLHRLIGLEQLVILYGKSGYGKSSLLSAGIFPRLQAEGQRHFLEVRFGPHRPANTPPPADTARQALLRLAPHPVNPVDPVQNPHPVHPVLLPDAEPSLWLTLKNRQLAGQNRFLLVFDQFEELFTYPPDQILEFKKQLAEALYSRVPKRYEAALAAANLSPEQEDTAYAPLDLKVVFSIRSDRMSLLNGLKDYLPNLLQHGYELDALDEAAATEAVCRPASLGPTPNPSPSGEGGLPSVPVGDFGTGNKKAFQLEEQPSGLNVAPLPPGGGVGGGAFDTPPFAYAPETLGAIFAALRNERGRIETSALQIVCKYVEDNVIGGRETDDGGRVTVEAHDLGDIKSIFRQFYERTLENLPEAERGPARRLVEDRLIQDGARIPYAAQALLAEPGVTSALLEHLAAASLLRVERDEQGRMLYEVGHDTLVAPISEAAQARRAEEEKIRLQQEADEQRREKEKAVAARRSARIVAIGAVILSVVAIAASIWAWRQTLLAGQEAENARQKELLADSSARVAVQREMEAIASADTARLREQQALAAEQRAADALRMANDNAEVAVRVLLQQAAGSVYHLNYTDALTSLYAAVKLDRHKHDVAKALYDVAFFYTETNKPSEASNILSTAAALLGKTPAPGKTPATLRSALKTLDSGWHRIMTERYYPVLVPIPGGEFVPGCIAPEDCADNPNPYRVRLSDYRLARTETTFWQWGLYCADKGLNLRDFSPSWGIDGDNPAVNVDWFHAVEYANWLSHRFGLEPVYRIDSLDKENRRRWIVTIPPGAAAKGGFRLPTEAEWEYAARGGPSQYPYQFAGGDVLDDVGWYEDNSDTLGVRRTRPVATRMPLIIAPDKHLYDLSGNVWEWCWDWYGRYPSDAADPVPNPYGPPEGDQRVPRGGSWYDYVIYCGRPGLRDGDVPDFGNYFRGFRVARH